MLDPSIFQPLELKADHLRNAGLYADRYEMVKALGPREGRLAEVGVALGDFSDFMISNLSPASFHAFDIFEMHLVSEHWGTPSKELFKGMTHLDFYKHRFEGKHLEVVIGPSSETLPQMPDRFFDLIYVDANHEYEAVRADVALSAAKIKDDGLLIFNDYTLYDTFLKIPYGVVQAVNELVVNDGWKIVGFALNRNMFCDIALKR